MSIENLNDRSCDDLMAELRRLPLPPAEKLATYLKTMFQTCPPVGWCGMRDEDWAKEAEAVLEAIRE